MDIQRHPGPKPQRYRPIEVQVIPWREPDHCPGIIDNYCRLTRVYVGSYLDEKVATLQGAGHAAEEAALADPLVAWDEPPFEVRGRLTYLIDSLSTDEGLPAHVAIQLTVEPIGVWRLPA